MSQPSIRKNYVYSLLYQILTMLTPFITAPYIARVLGAEGVGIYSYTSSCMTYFSMFAALGTSSYGMREVARCRNNQSEYSRVFWEIEVLRIISTALCLFAWIVVIILSDKYKYYFVGLVPMLVATMFDISWFYTGHEKIEYTIFWNGLCKILGVVSIFLFIKSKNDLLIYILINSGVLMLGNMSMWFFLPRMLVKVELSRLCIKKHFKETLIYFIPTIATTIYTVLDKTLIGIITHDDFQNGYYEQANKIINMTKTIVFVSVNKIMEARISYLYVGGNYNEIKMRIEKSFSYILLLAYGSMFGIIAIAKDLVPLFFGDGYEPVIILLYLMSPLVVIIGISNCLGSHYYTPAGLRAQSAKYIIWGSIVNLIANIILIPKYRSSGAVVGSLIAEISISYLYLKNCNRYLEFRTILRLSYKRVISGSIMLFLIFLLSELIDTDVASLVVKIILGTIFYFGILIILKDDFVCGVITALKKRSLLNWEKRK